MERDCGARFACARARASSSFCGRHTMAAVLSINRTHRHHPKHGTIINLRDLHAASIAVVICMPNRHLNAVCRRHHLSAHGSLTPPCLLTRLTSVAVKRDYLILIVSQNHCACSPRRPNPSKEGLCDTKEAIFSELHLRLLYTLVRGI